MCVKMSWIIIYFHSRKNQFWVVSSLLCVCVCVCVAMQFGGQYYEDVENTSVQCQVVEGVMCHGNTSFVKTGVPCIK